MFFTPGPVRNFDEAKTSDTDRFARYYRKMLENGVYLAPSQFEAVFVSAAHDTADIDQTLSAAEDAMAGL
jgi:glutamate-1-semialdehyde 2,1-aminomutase